MLQPLFQQNGGVLPILGFGAGLLFFFRGLRYYRETLVVADTPAIPIRSVAMGLVQIHGMAKGEGAFPSPVSGVPCYAFKVQIERWRRNTNRRGWVHYRTDVNGTHFYLEDPTGHVQVDPRGADLDLLKNCRRTVPEGSWSAWTDKEADFPSTDADDALMEVRSDDDLLEYAQGVGGDITNRFRFTEYCVVPGKEYDVLGTCVENPHPNGPDDRNLITKGQNEQTYLVSSKVAGQLERSLYWKSALMVWGGVALTAVCAGLILSEFGLF
jgi:E3 Ubiquitin ligase